MWQNHQQSYANPRFMLYASRVHTPDPSSTLRLELVIRFIWLNPVFQQPMVGWCPLVWYLLTINIQEKGRIYIMTYDFLTKTSTIFLGNLMLLAAHGHQKPHQVLSRTVLRKFPRPHTVPSGSTRVSHLQLASRSRSSRPSSEAWLMVMTRAYCRYCMILRDASSMNSKCVCRKLWVYRYTPLMVILRGTMMIKQRIFGGFSGTCICFIWWKSDEPTKRVVTVKQRIQLKLPYDFGSPWRVDMRKLGWERLAHCLGKEVALWLTRDKKRNPSPKIVQKHPLFDDIPVSIVSGRAGSSKVNIIAANIAMLKNGREREINHDQWSTLGFEVGL